ncbi:MAG: hypothetical protein KAU36_09395 [candidate division Zixibacteria bacterium]|nr:hypothetical protein [candidate division Zixibacteria bacterium]
MKRYCLTSLMLLALVATAWSANNKRQIILHVESPPLPYCDSHVAQKLKVQLSRKVDLRVSLAQEINGMLPPLPASSYDLDSLLNWGQEAGGRYLVLVDIDREGLKRKKTIHIPLIAHKYENVGVIEGELRLIDISRSKLLAAEAFSVEMKGSKIFQATMDDDINDPDLHLTAPDKIRFFGRMETMLSEKLVSRIHALIGGR